MVAVLCVLVLKMDGGECVVAGWDAGRTVSSPKLIVPTNLQMVMAPAGMFVWPQSRDSVLQWGVDRGLGVGRFRNVDWGCRGANN